MKASVSPEQAIELAVVDRLAEELLAPVVATREEIALLHVHGARSKAIQDHFAKLLREDLGFGEEVVLTTQSGLVTQAWPDFFFEPSEGAGDHRRGRAWWHDHQQPRPQGLVEGARRTRRPSPVPDCAA